MDVILDDVSLSGERMSDIYVKGSVINNNNNNNLGWLSKVSGVILFHIISCNLYFNAFYSILFHIIYILMQIVRCFVKGSVINNNNNNNNNNNLGWLSKVLGVILFHFISYNLDFNSFYFILFHIIDI